MACMIQGGVGGGVRASWGTSNRRAFGNSTLGSLKLPSLLGLPSFKGSRMCPLSGGAGVVGDVEYLWCLLLRFLLEVDVSSGPTRALDFGGLPCPLSPYFCSLLRIFCCSVIKTIRLGILNTNILVMGLGGYRFWASGFGSYVCSMDCRRNPEILAVTPALLGEVGFKQWSGPLLDMWHRNSSQGP